MGFRTKLKASPEEDHSAHLCFALGRDAVCSVGTRGCGEGRQIQFVLTAQEMLRRRDGDGTGIDIKYLTKELWRSDHI